MKSAWLPKDNLVSYTVPQHDVSKRLDEISKSGGIVNAANAIEMAKMMASNLPAKSNKKKSTTN